MQPFLTIVTKKDKYLEKVDVMDMMPFLAIFIGNLNLCEFRERLGSARTGSERQK